MRHLDGLLSVACLDRAATDPFEQPRDLGAITSVAVSDEYQGGRAQGLRLLAASLRAPPSLAPKDERLKVSTLAGSVLQLLYL
jgi:hypothetical protein